MIVLIALGVFLAAVAIDYASAKYMLAFQEEDAGRAAAWSVVICLLSAIGLLAMVDCSVWMLLPEAAGVYLGTRLGAVQRRRG